jgi:hypothetical protein
LASDFLDIEDLKDELGCGRRRAYLVARVLGNTLGNKLYVTRSALEQHLHPVPAGGGAPSTPGCSPGAPGRIATSTRAVAPSAGPLTLSGGTDEAKSLAKSVLEASGLFEVKETS